MNCCFSCYGVRLSTVSVSNYGNLLVIVCTYDDTFLFRNTGQSVAENTLIKSSASSDLGTHLLLMERKERFKG